MIAGRQRGLLVRIGDAAVCSPDDRGLSLLTPLTHHQSQPTHFDDMKTRFALYLAALLTAGFGSGSFAAEPSGPPKSGGK